MGLDDVTMFNIMIINWNDEYIIVLNNNLIGIQELLDEITPPEASIVFFIFYLLSKSKINSLVKASVQSLKMSYPSKCNGTYLMVIYIAVSGTNKRKSFSWKCQPTAEG